MSYGGFEGAVERKLSDILLHLNGIRTDYARLTHEVMQTNTYLADIRIAAVKSASALDAIFSILYKEADDADGHADV